MHIITNNPALAFDVGDAGGKEQSRNRNLSRDEIAKLFAEMKVTKGFGIENDISIKLLLALAVRKGELIGARWVESDLLVQLENGAMDKVIPIKRKGIAL